VKPDPAFHSTAFVARFELTPARVLAATHDASDSSIVSVSSTADGHAVLHGANSSRSRSDDPIKGPLTWICRRSISVYCVVFFYSPHAEVDFSRGERRPHTTGDARRPVAATDRTPSSSQFTIERRSVGGRRCALGGRTDWQAGDTGGLLDR